MTKWQHRQASRIFNSSSINSVINGDLSLVESISRDYLGYKTQKHLRVIYDEVFAKLSKNYKNEYLFKNLITKRLLLNRHNLKTATMLSEFRVGKCKADCVILNGHSTCYEIKTEYDSLSRLEEQVDTYQKVFDEVYVVSTPNHYPKLVEILDKPVGIYLLTENNYLRLKRKAEHIGGSIDIDLVCDSLRKPEYSELVYKLTGTVPHVPNALFHEKCKSVIKASNNNEVRKYYIEILKSHRAVNAELIKILPESLLTAAISYDITTSKAKSLKKIFAE